jgi:hypothetical protein
MAKGGSSGGGGSSGSSAGGRGSSAGAVGGRGGAGSRGVGGATGNYNGPRGSGGGPLLRDYLTANSGAGQAMGQRLAQHVGISGASVLASGDALATQHKQRVQSGSPWYADQELSDPGKLGEQARAGQLKGYTGPMDLEGAAGLSAQAAKAEEAARLATTPAGRATLLGKLYGGGSTTVGGGMLDSALAGQGAAKPLAALSARYGTLSQYAQRTADDARATSEKAAGAVGANLKRLEGLQPKPSAPPPVAPAQPTPGYNPPGSGHYNTGDASERARREKERLMGRG